MTSEQELLLFNEVEVKSEVFEGGGGDGGEEITILSCLICLSSDTGGPQSWKQGFWRPGGVEPLSLSRNLSTVFLLRNLLGVDSGQVASILSSTFGVVEPGAWVRLCGECSEHVRKAYQLHQECCKLQRKIETIGETLRKEIRKSWSWREGLRPGLEEHVDGGGRGGGGVLSVHQLIRDFFQEGGESRDDDVGTDEDLESGRPVPASSAPVPPHSGIAGDNQLRDNLEKYESDSNDDHDDDDDDDGANGHGMIDVQVESETDETVPDSDQSSDPSYIIPTDDDDDDQVSDDKEDKQMRRLPSSSSITRRTRESPRMRRRRRQSSRKTPPSQLIANKKARGNLEVEEKVSELEGMTVRLIPQTGKAGRPKKIFECNYCQMGFQDSSRAGSHIKKIHLKPQSSSPASFACPVCNHPFRCQPGSCSFQQSGGAAAAPEDNSILVHFVQIQPQMRGKGRRKFKKMHKCKLCEQSFGTKDKAQAHVKKLHSNKSAPPDLFKCPICGYPSRCHGSRLGHMVRLHPKADLRCGRERCEFQTDSASTYFRHETEHKYKDALEQVGEEEVGGGGEGDKEKEVKFRCKFCSGGEGGRGVSGSWLKMTRHLKNKHLAQLGVQGYACSLCEMVFLKRGSLTRHLKQAHRTNKTGEPITGAGNSRDLTGDAFVSHLKTAHSSDKGRGRGRSSTTKVEGMRKKRAYKKISSTSLQCEKCDFSTTAKRAFGRHLQQHMIMEHFEPVVESASSYPSSLLPSQARCKLCNALVASSVLLRHLRWSHESELNLGDGLFKCHVCGMGFNLDISLRGHLRRSHNVQVPTGADANQRKYKCRHCEMEFTYLIQRSRHYKVAHSGVRSKERAKSTIPKHTRAPRNTTYRCDKCDFVTKVRGAYIQHIQNHSLTLHFQEVEVESEGGPSSAVVNVKYLCKLCGIRCTRMKRYSHLNQMHAEVIELQLLQCHLCGKRFNKTDSVKTHLAWHAQQQQQQQQQHPSSSSGEIETATFVCETCGDLCASSAQLISHRRRCHPEVEKPAAQMSCCKVCGFSCRGSVPLSEHMRESHGELYKFKCELCSKGFLQEHTVQVHKEKYHFKETRVT